MIYPLGKSLTPSLDFLALPFNDNDIFIIVRNSDLEKPIAVRWGDFKNIISSLISSGAVSVSEDGNIVVNKATNINFTGDGVTVSGGGDSATINIPGGPGSGVEIQTEGSPNANQMLLNFLAGNYMHIQDNGLGGEIFSVIGILSSEIVVAEMNSIITIPDQSDNHATQVNMGTWDGLSLFNIVYNTKLNPKDGSIIEVVISDTFSTDNLGPGSVELTIKYGLTIIFSGTVDADRAIRFRYEADTDEWFPVSYASASSFSIGGLPTQILYKDAANNVVGDNNAIRTALGTLIKNENTGLGQFGQILISPATAILTVEETVDDHVSNIGIFGNLGSNSILLSQRNFANTDSSQIRLHTSLIQFSGEVATVPFNYKFPLTSPSSGEVLGWVSANQLGWVTPGGGGSSIVNRGFNIGNGNIVVAVGLASRALVVDFNCNVISWTFTSTNVTGSMSIDIIRKNGAIPVYPTDSIVGAGVKPNLSSAKYAKSAPSGWTSTTLAAGDVLQIFINSNTLITAATLTLELQPI